MYANRLFLCKFFFLISLLLYAHTSKAVDPIGWRIINPFPAIAELNKNYTETYQLTSNLHNVMDDPLIVEKNGPYFYFDDQCTGLTLAPQQTCNVFVDFISSIEAVRSLQLTLRYGLNVVPLPRQEIKVKKSFSLLGNVNPGLPNLLSPNLSYPVSFNIENTSTLAATQIKIEKNYPIYFVEQINNCGTQLNPGDRCSISGSLTPKVFNNSNEQNKVIKILKNILNRLIRKKEVQNRAVENKEITVGITVNADGESLNLSTRGVVSEIAVDGSTNPALPPDTLVGHDYPMQFLIQNNSDVKITEVVLTPQFPESVFTLNQNTCGSSLAAHTSCVYAGNFKAQQANDYSLTLNFSYKEGETIVLNTYTTTTSVFIFGEINPSLPPNSVVGTPYPVQFNFTNKSEQAATNIQLTKIYPNEFTINENTCGEQLPGNMSCYLSGTYLAKDLSVTDPTLTTLFSYLEGAQVPLSVSTHLNEVALNGEVEPLPSITSLGKSYFFKFTLNNPSSFDLTGVKVTNDFPKDVSIIEDDCSQKTSFLPYESCIIKGRFTTQTEGDYQLSSRVSYIQGPELRLKTSTTAIKVEVTGVIDQTLPSNSNLNTSYPVSFRFSNATVGIATGIHLTKKFPNDFHENMDTCRETLQAGSSCVLQGLLTPLTVGIQSIELQFNYDEGTSISLQTETDVNNIAIEGFIKRALPKATAINIPYDAIFEFKNTGTTNATKVKITNLNANLDIYKNTCKTILAANQSCTIEGEFYPSREGTHKAGVSLSYYEGKNIDLITSTQVGKPRLVTVGLQGYSGASSDGHNWSKLDLPKNIQLNSITWSDDLLKYLAVGTNGNAGIAMLSSDGKNWETFNTTSANPNKVIWNKTFQQFITVGSAGIVEISVDGKSWIRRSVPVTNSLNSIIWNDTLQQYVIVGNEGVILTSPDGYRWQIESSKLSDNLTGIAWDDYFKQYVVVTSTKYRYLRSNDAKRWRSYENSVLDQPIYDIAWSPNLAEFAAGGLFHSIYISKDGEDWIKRASSSEVTPRYLIHCMIWDHSFNSFYAVDLSGSLYASRNGINWNYYPLDGGISGNGRGVTSISDGVLLPNTLAIQLK